MRVGDLIECFGIWKCIGVVIAAAPHKSVVYPAETLWGVMILSNDGIRSMLIFEREFRRLSIKDAGLR